MAAPESWPSPLRNALRVFNKYVLNPLMKQVAGRRHWYAAVIEHTGRRSGKRYSTPIVANPVVGGLLVPLPYGTRVDWLRNVLAADRATITDHGKVSEVCDPEVVDAATALPLLEPGWRRIYRRQRVQAFLRVSADPGR
jgi:deazaflavin-dependent oxidoreductase (nitroreductase family)